MIGRPDSLVLGGDSRPPTMWLGHHSPAFTLATYGHLRPDDMPDAAILDGVVGLASP